MTLRIPAKVLIHVWSYDFYDMTLSTGKQRRHMINDVIHWKTLTSYDNKDLQLCILLCDHALKTIRSTCETGHVLLAGVQCGFSRGFPGFATTF